MKTAHQKLLEAIKSRQSKLTEFNGGILTGDKYALTLQQCVGSDLCYRYGAHGNVSFDDAVKRAAGVLTYNNDEMVVEDIYVDYKSRFEKDTSIELPKNTLMVFKHVLTTPKKDRDGDILRTQGAKPDPKMLLLWQHVHTLPIGKMLMVVEHTSKSLSLVTAIIDINELAHDAAVMVDNDMGRFSHGFRALSFTQMKETPAQPTAPGGFDVKEFEIMEESIVSVPSNTDATTQEIMLDLIEGDKLTSSMMKAYGKKIREEKKTTTVAGGLPDELKEEKGTDCGCGKKPEECGCNKPKDPAAGKSSEETNGDTKDKGKSEDSEDEEMMCPKCKVACDKTGVCPKCGWKAGAKETADETKQFETEWEKSGRVLSKSNYVKLSEVHSGMRSLQEHCSTRTGKELCVRFASAIKEVLDGQNLDDMEIPPSKPRSHDSGSKEAVSAKTHATEFLTKAEQAERNDLFSILKALREIDEQESVTQEFRKIVGSY